MGADDERSTHPSVWASVAACGVVVAVAALLPGFTAGFGAYVGAGNSQRILSPFERTYTLLEYAHPRYLAALAAVLVAVAAAAWAWRRATAWAPLAAILAAAVIALALTSPVLRETNGPLGGVFLRDAVREVQVIAGNSRESRNPAFGVSGYSARAEIGWWLTQGALYVLLAIASIALGRRSGHVGTAVAVFAVVAAVLVFGVPGESCGDFEAEHDPDSNPLGLLAVFGGLACTGLGIGVLTRTAWAAATLAILAGIAIAFVAVVVLAARDCAFS